MENFSDNFDQPELPCRADCFKQAPIQYKPILCFGASPSNASFLSSVHCVTNLASSP